MKVLYWMKIETEQLPVATDIERMKNKKDGKCLPWKRWMMTSIYNCDVEEENWGLDLKNW